MESSPEASTSTKSQMKLVACVFLAALGHAKANTHNFIRRNLADHEEAFEEESKWYARFTQEDVSSLAPPKCICDVELDCTYVDMNTGVEKSCEELQPIEPPNTGEVSNCRQEIVYKIDACNKGNVDLTLFELQFELNGVVKDLLAEGEAPFLTPGECYDKLVTEYADICVGGTYDATVTQKTDCEEEDALSTRTFNSRGQG